ncbi:Cupin domain protein [Sulfitobacter noctilucicola]|uniref:Mannose-6-phosphate isomerase-like protein (Cupin superfamily) n=1 Tax=Sulfitobacter noctilucicola TaxID=1342301 RepID=A0A7W6M5N1_9RHOB|nr:cupin domain-containing protein [Sulfitobacter noctilucicola]KIN62922.1 Cupin domain protein [Sulfitobacter noctilucicola]MBB4172548.1 mannose-6-phosphate isomerase-like protein (cupin superfamily) [Sulfitobacter noctilucicola]
MTKPVNIAAKLSQINTHWDPHIIANYNDNDIMVVKFQGEFPFHLHEDTDDFFLVLRGEMVMDIEETSHPVKAGEIFVVPKGVTHRPRSVAECEVLLIEPKGVPNTGDPATASAKSRL